MHHVWCRAARGGRGGERSGGGAAALDGDVDTSAKVGFLAPVIVFGYIGNVVVGAPFWAVKEVFYELPSKAISKEPENITN